MQLKTPKAEFAVQFLDLPEAAEIEGAEWEEFQIRFLNNDRRFGIDSKSRQIAWSFSAALDAVIDGIINPGTPHIFVSINQEEAKEKIRYAKQILDNLHCAPNWKAYDRSSLTQIELANGSRLISHPCRAPRGKPRARIYLDEWAHYPRGLDKEIYRGALPATTKGDGYIRGGSSPMGASGLFWEIMTQSMERFPGYDHHRRYIPWWHVHYLSNDVRTAVQTAPFMTTHDRVNQFGTASLIEIFQNFFLEDFQQEYECAWVDEASAWLHWKLIQGVQNHDQSYLYWHATNPTDALAFIPEILEQIKQGNLETSFYAGLDVGRMKDFTEFMMLGSTTDGGRPLRYTVSLDRISLPEQQDLFREILRRLPIAQLLVDRSGIGLQLAEALENSGNAEGVNFTNANKELWAVEARNAFEGHTVTIPPDRDLAYQLHSLKRFVTPSKNIKFDTESSEKHHADKAWSLFLALWAAKQYTSGAEFGAITLSGYGGRRS